MKTGAASKSLGQGRGTAPFPGTPSQKQNLAVYTKELTHLPGFIAFSYNFATTQPFPVLPTIPLPVNPPVPLYNSFPSVFPPHLQLPYTLQWNASVEQALGKSQALTVSYVGAHASRLLKQTYVSTPNNPNATQFDFIDNGLTSDYEALQTQFRRRLAQGFTALASYTWSHCIDYGSQNYFLVYQRGSCDFDVRHNLSTAFSYELPNVRHVGLANALLHHWGIDDRFTARTAFPVTLNGTAIPNPVTGQLFNAGLNLVPGQPIYIYGSQCAAVYNNGLGCPGGRAINPNAFSQLPGCTPFSCPPGTGSGDAPRNLARGFGALQMDMAVRREFPIRERLKLQFRAEAFNIFNHPNLGAINSNYCSLDPTSSSYSPGCTFGQATGSLANSLGVLSPLYQMGGPRSMQFALKLVF